MKIPEKPFKLIERPLTREEANLLERKNKPMVQIIKTYGKYKTLDIDFITCDWCLSSEGQETLQARLNTEVTFMWLRGYNLGLNKNNVGNMVIVLRGDNLAITYLINELDSLTINPDRFFMKYRDGEKMLNIDRSNRKVNPVYHPKQNTNKIN
ncbi:hypothetical protein [Mammaliicoccus lentus]|uniref:hypothetical protein n=1 Tax=Mammaliicoccus lentus TaxID=42858 RepID=UPI003A598F7C